MWPWPHSKNVSFVLNEIVIFWLKISVKKKKKFFFFKNFN